MEGFERGDNQDQEYQQNNADGVVYQLDDDYYDNQDEEKFQREILSDEPNLIKLYLQVDGFSNIRTF